MAYPRTSGVIAFGLISIALACAAVFFAYYTARLAWVNLTATDIRAHRQTGMFIGAVAFPLAALLFGYLAVLCARVAMRHAHRGGRF